MHTRRGNEDVAANRLAVEKGVITPSVGFSVKLKMQKYITNVSIFVLISINPNTSKQRLINKSQTKGVRTFQFQDDATLSSTVRWSLCPLQIFNL